MAGAIGLRGDYDAGALRAAAKRTKDGPQARRLLALAAIYDGATRTEAAKICGSRCCEPLPAVSNRSLCRNGDKRLWETQTYVLTGRVVRP